MNTSEKDLAKNATSTYTLTNTMSLFPTDHLEVANIISTMKSNTAPGWDKISTGFLKTYKSS